MHTKTHKNKIFRLIKSRDDPCQTVSSQKPAQAPPRLVGLGKPSSALQIIVYIDIYKLIV